MSHEKLLDQFRRLLEYSGAVVDEVSITKDGATAVLYLEGKPHRVFIAPLDQKPMFKPQILEGSTFLTDPY